jgi:hypothetical protein
MEVSLWIHKNKFHRSEGGTRKRVSMVAGVEQGDQRLGGEAPVDEKYSKIVGLEQHVAVHPKDSYR